MTSPFGCFLCNSLEHWADNCPTVIPPENKAEHEKRIAQYVQWFRDDDPPRITPHQKRKLIEHENRMWAGIDPARRRAS